jgi:SAM-dependent methyltransferase
MASAAEHYERHLAPVYLWMSDGIDAALYRGDTEIDGVLPHLACGSAAVDLGAGFGMHAIPLARRGCSVLAIDSSSMLLAALKARAGPLPVRTVEDDLASFRRHLSSTVDLVLCMGDTLTHLPSARAVDELFSNVAEALRRGGTFIVAFRDYTPELVGEARFIPVKSDDARILTCFLEYEPESVLVHDILHERGPGGWQTRVSHYRKLRLSPDALVDSLQSKGFIVRRESGLGGMVRLVAHGKG